MELIFTQLFISLIILAACWVKNPNKNYLKGFSISLSLIPSIFLLNWIEFLTEDLIYMLTLLAGIIAVTLYFLRFWKKTNKWNPLEIIKLIAVIQFCFSYGFLQPEQSGISLFILGFVFLSTRAAQLNSNNMVRNSIIGFLILVTIFFIVYANIKANEAEKINSYTLQRVDDLEIKLDSVQLQLSECRGEK